MLGGYCARPEAESFGPRGVAAALRAMRQAHSSHANKHIDDASGSWDYRAVAMVQRIGDRTMTILRDLSSKSNAELIAMVQALQANGQKRITMKVSEGKQCLSVYGLGRYPVTLYAQQWERLLDVAGDIKAFIKEHHDELSWKE